MPAVSAESAAEPGLPPCTALQAKGVCIQAHLPTLSQQQSTQVAPTPKTHTHAPRPPVNTYTHLHDNPPCSPSMQTLSV